MVHSTCRAPACTPASEFATARPKSLWQWVEIVTLSIPATRSRRIRSRRPSRNDWPSDRRGNCLYRFEVAVGGNGKARFDHVHAEDIQLLSQAHFLLYVHAAARRLLAVAKCRVENGNAWPIHGIHPPG